MPMENATPVEVIWVAMCFVGLAGALILLGMWWSRLCALKRLGINGEARSIARERLRNKVGYAFVFAAALWLGLLGVMAPSLETDADGPIERWALENLVSGVMPVLFILVGVPAVLMAWAVIDDIRRERHRDAQTALAASIAVGVAAKAAHVARRAVQATDAPLAPEATEASGALLANATEIARVTGITVEAAMDADTAAQEAVRQAEQTEQP